MSNVEVIPNLFIIGAMKSGTTSLHNYLDMHSEIYMSKPKELSFFVEELNWNKGYKWYLSHFLNINNSKIIGESSTAYSKYPTYQNVADKINAFNPYAKIIYIMRDPVERAISHYWHEVRQLREKRDINQALKCDYRYIQYSDYAMQLSHYFYNFKKDNIKLITYEEMASNPKKMIFDIIKWLNIEPSELNSKTFGEKYYQTPEQVFQGRFLILNNLRQRKIWQYIHPYIPKMLLKFGNKLAYKKIEKNSINIEEVKDWLRHQLYDSYKNLQKLTGDNYINWKTFHNV